MIDRAFVATLESQPEHVKVADAIISRGHNLGMYVIAVGVESAQTLVRLRALGFHEPQGYFFRHLLEADAMPDWLDQRS